MSLGHYNLAEALTIQRVDVMPVKPSRPDMPVQGHRYPEWKRLNMGALKKWYFWCYRVHIRHERTEGHFETFCRDNYELERELEAL